MTFENSHHSAEECSGEAMNLSSHARMIATRAEALAAEIDALHRKMKAASDHPVRLAGFRCDAANGSLRQAAGELRDTAADLERIAAADAPSACSVQWGACPEHGNTLSSCGGRTWCRHSACTRTWDHDRVSLPCAEPARWRMTDRLGDAALVCQGHAVALRSSLEHLRIVPLAVERPRRPA